MATMRTESQLYAELEAYVKANIPTLTSFSEGSPERALAKLCAYAVSLLWKMLYSVYINIWGTTADRAGLRRWYEVFGLVWVGAETKVARAQVLAKFRERFLGTASWYELTATEQFAEVTEAYFFAGRRGVNTGDLLVLHHGGDVLESTVASVQAYFDAVERKVCCIDVRVLTRRDVEAELVAEEAAT